MSHASEITIQVLIKIVQVSAVGTNLALLQLMWAMVNGSFLQSRGAVMTALHLSGFTPKQIRRSWQALRSGVWNIGEMLGAWRGHVISEGHWQARRYEGYKPLAADVTTFWRPRLRGWKVLPSILRSYNRLVGLRFRARSSPSSIYPCRTRPTVAVPTSNAWLMASSFHPHLP